jgi:hypothetical protein
VSSKSSSQWCDFRKRQQSNESQLKCAKLTTFIDQTSSDQSGLKVRKHVANLDCICRYNNISQLNTASACRSIQGLLVRGGSGLLAGFSHARPDSLFAAVPFPCCFVACMHICGLFLIRRCVTCTTRPRLCHATMMVLRQVIAEY